MTEGVIRGGLGDAETWLDPDELRWFAPPAETAESGSRRREALRHVEASLGDLSRAAAAALAPPPMLDTGGAIAAPSPVLPPRPGARSYREARRRGWSPRRRRRFATRFVPAATLVVSAAVTLPSLLARDDRATRIGVAALATPLLQESGSSSGLLPRVPTTSSTGSNPVGLAPFEVSNLGSGDFAFDGTTGSTLVSPDVAAASSAAEAATGLPAEPAPASPPEYEKIEWRKSQAHGVPFGGHLHNSVRLPIEGPNWITWDPALNQVPNRAWRLHGTDTLIRMVVNIAKAHRAANPGAPPLLIGDISAPDGGPLDHHSSHQNGLDVDIYYPRKDGKPTEPTSPEQIDVALTQDIVNRFLATGRVQFIFVGYHTGVTGPSGIVQPYPHHENHLHARIYPPN